MRRTLKDLLLGVTDVPYAYGDSLSDSSLTYIEKNRKARQWLKTFQLQNLDFLRSLNYEAKSKIKNLTVITYTFPKEESDYLQVEFAVLHTWRMIGRLPTVIVANKHFPLLDDFAKKWSDSISIQIQDALICGDNRSISLDCLENLHKRFSSEYCLTVQDDGFPIRNNLEEFIGHYDFIGAPAIRARVRILEFLIQAANKTWLNGGFSLRTHRLCELGAQAYAEWRVAEKPFQQEDFFFSHTLRQFTKLSSSLKFPSLQRAREFSATDIGGCIDIHARGYAPCGFHSPTTVLQFKTELSNLGYSIPE